MYFLAIMRADAIGTIAFMFARCAEMHRINVLIVRTRILCPQSAVDEVCGCQSVCYGIEVFEVEQSAKW